MSVICELVYAITAARKAPVAAKAARLSDATGIPIKRAEEIVTDVTPDLTVREAELTIKTFLPSRQELDNVEQMLGRSITKSLALVPIILAIKKMRDK